MNQRPKIAIVDSNTLASLGLKQLLLNVMPIMTVDTFGSFSELESSNIDEYFHYFVAMDIVIRNRQFFINHKQKTIVLTLSLNDSAQLTDFHSLYINQTGARFANLTAACAWRWAQLATHASNPATKDT